MPLDFALTAEQQAIRELAHEFAANEIRRFRGLSPRALLPASEPPSN
jgi:hypothetical protein